MLLWFFCSVTLSLSLSRSIVRSIERGNEGRGVRSAFGTRHPHRLPSVPIRSLRSDQFASVSGLCSAVSTALYNFAFVSSSDTAFQRAAHSIRPLRRRRVLQSYVSSHASCLPKCSSEREQFRRPETPLYRGSVGVGPSPLFLSCPVPSCPVRSTMRAGGTPTEDRINFLKVLIRNSI